MTTMTDGLEMVETYTEVHEVLRDRRFIASAGRPEGRAFLGDSLVVIDGSEHLARRRMYMPLLQDEQLQRFEDDIFVPLMARCDEVHLTAADGRRRGDLVAWARDLFMRFAAALIGFDGYDSDATTRRLFELLGPLSEGATVEWSPRDHDEVLREGLAAKAAYREEFFQPSWDRRVDLVGRHRQGELAEDELPGDILTRMALKWDDDWDDDLPVRESILFLAGATGNPVGQIVYALEDLDGWIADHPERAAELQDERFLRHAIAETLRLHIAGSPVLIREAIEDVELRSGNRLVRAGERVGLDMRKANTDPEIFGPTADVYDPDRYTDLPRLVKHYGVAFGGGKHTCLGKPLVMGREDGADIDGLQYTALRHLLDAGARPDPDAPARMAESGQRYYASFPIVLADATTAP